MESIELATDACRTALGIAVEIALPILAAGLVIALCVSVAQAATQIQEQTLATIPKLFAMVAALFVLVPWILSVLTSYTREVFTTLSRSSSVPW